MTTDDDHSAREEPVDPLDRAVARLDLLDSELDRLRRVTAVIALVGIVCASGWWLTSRDHTATERNGRVADCRAAELGRTLDGFAVLVSPNTSKAERDVAAKDLGELPTLDDRYQECGTS